MPNFRPARAPLAMLALAVLALAVLSAPERSLADGPLVSVPVSAHGWQRAARSSHAAERDLTARLSRRLRGAAHRCHVQAAAAVRRGGSLREELFVCGSARTALAVVHGWAQGHGGRARVGQDGRLVPGRGVARVIWRENSRLGLLILRERGSAATQRADALAYARLADVALRARPPRDAWTRLLDEAGPGRSVSRSTVLAAFAFAYGPLPGVRTPAGPHRVIASGTLAAWWAWSSLRSMTPAQRSVVERRLELAPSGAHGHAARAPAPLPAGDVFVPEYQSVANRWRAAYERLLGRPLGLNMIVVRSPDVGAKDLADAMPVDAQGGSGSGLPVICRIRMGPKGAAVPKAYRDNTIAHEVFHCFEYTILGARTWARPDKWIIEGLADWAALTVDPIPFEPSNSYGGGAWIKQYIDTPPRPLFSRTYDAASFWGHLADVTGPLWNRVPAILNAGSDIAAFQAAGAGADRVLSTWGASVFRLSGQGSFSMRSPIPSPGYSALPPGFLNDVTTDAVSAPPYATAQYIVHAAPGAPLIHVRIDGHARLRSGANEYADLGDALFCVHGNECKCPPGSTGTLPPTQPLSVPAYLGITGDPPIGTAGFVKSEKLEDFCHPRPKPHPRPQPGPPRSHPLGCGAGCGASNGDPHLHPFDADPYEFQAAGEYTLARSLSGTLEVQARQQPWERSRDLSVNAAIALRVGRSTIELDAGRVTRLLVNHRRHALGRATLGLSGGGRIRLIAPLDSGSGPAFDITWPDGSRARVWPIEDFGLAIMIAPARSLTGKLTGLLGNIGGPPNGDFVGRDGRHYPADLITGSGPLSSAARYGGLGESWRVRQTSSLFTYPRGKQTGSYTVRGFPFDQYDLSGTTAAQQAQAEQLCRSAGVSEPAALSDCLVDVLGTGRRGFAVGALGLQASAGSHGLRASHPWTKLSSADDSATDVVASLLGTPTGASAAYRNDASGAIELADLSLGVDGVTLRGRSTPLTSWTSIADPVLAAAGANQALLTAGLHSDDSSDPLNGTTVFGRTPGGGLAAPVSLSSSVADGLGAGATLSSDGATLLWSSTTSGQLAVHLGGDELDLPTPGLAENSALGRDGAGRLWLAWHAIGVGSADGLYLRELDPGTGAPVAAAQHAPDSDGGNVQPRPALACAAQCRVAYIDARDQRSSTLLSWTAGESTPTVVVRGGDGIGALAAAYTSRGRLWVTWVQSGRQLMAKLGDARGAGGGAQELPPPPSHDTPDHTAAIASGERLVLATEWSASSAEINSEWATVVDPQ